MGEKKKVEPLTLAGAITAAGGCTIVGEEVGVSQQGVSAWIKRGLPMTDYVGKTSYAAAICSLASDRGYEVDHASLLSICATARCESAA